MCGFSLLLSFLSSKPRILRVITIHLPVADLLSLALLKLTSTQVLVAHTAIMCQLHLAQGMVHPPTWKDKNSYHDTVTCLMAKPSPLHSSAQQQFEHQIPLQTTPFHTHIHSRTFWIHY
jgi:hypothetical protein